MGKDQEDKNGLGTLFNSFAGSGTNKPIALSGEPKTQCRDDVWRGTQLLGDELADNCSTPSQLCCKPCESSTSCVNDCTKAPNIWMISNAVDRQNSLAVRPMGDFVNPKLDETSSLFSPSPSPLTFSQASCWSRAVKWPTLANLTLAKPTLANFGVFVFWPKFLNPSSPNPKDPNPKPWERGPTLRGPALLAPLLLGPPCSLFLCPSGCLLVEFWWCF